MCLVLFLCNINETLMAEKRALVIGIGSYPNENGWDAINGDKDILLVEDYLRSNGFDIENIDVLKNEQATANNIRKAFQILINDAKEDDVVYIHFSGHGQLITDLNGDESDGFDESWVAYDAHNEYKQGIYEGKNHIIDDQINTFLGTLRKKVGRSGKITLVADACHSGTLTAFIHKVVNVSKCLIANIVSNNIKTYAMQQRGETSAFRIPHSKVVLFSSENNPIDWIFISACKSNQCNYEYNNVGSLTYAISLQKDSLSTYSCTQLIDSIKVTIKNKFFLTQTPVLERPNTNYQLTIF